MGVFWAARLYRRGATETAFCNCTGRPSWNVGPVLMVAGSACATTAAAVHAKTSLSAAGSSSSVGASTLASATEGWFTPMFILGGGGGVTLCGVVFARIPDLEKVI